LPAPWFVSSQTKTAVNTKEKFGGTQTLPGSTNSGQQVKFGAGHTPWQRHRF